MAFCYFGLAIKTKELKKFYPTSVLVTGFDIIFFWVARMLMMGNYFLKKLHLKKFMFMLLLEMKKDKKCQNQKAMLLILLN